MTPPPKLTIPDEALDIARALDDAGHEVWCVGGAIRDALLGAVLGGIRPAGRHRLHHFGTPGAGAGAVWRKRTVDVGSKHGTIGVLDRRHVLHEVTTFRRDVTTDGRHADVIHEGVSLEEDLARRDFTINAIAYHPSGGNGATRSAVRPTSSAAWSAR